MTTMSTVAIAPRTRVPGGRVWQVGLLAAAVATVGTVLVYTLARAAGVTFLVTLMPGTKPVLLPIAMVIVMSIAGAAAGTIACAVVRRLAPGRPLLFPIVGGVFLLLSFSMPLTLQATDGATKGSLILMHVMAGGSVIALLSRLVRRW